MADHGEVEYATATGNDYAAHESSYENFLKLTEVTILTVMSILIGLVLVGVKDAFASGGLIIAAACFAGGIGAFTQLGWKAPGLIFAIALIVWPLA